MTEAPPASGGHDGSLSPGAASNYLVLLSWMASPLFCRGPAGAVDDRHARRTEGSGRGKYHLRSREVPLAIDQQYPSAIRLRGRQRARKSTDRLFAGHNWPCDTERCLFRQACGQQPTESPVFAAVRRGEPLEASGPGFKRDAKDRTRHTCPTMRARSLAAAALALAYALQLAGAAAAQRRPLQEQVRSCLCAELTFACAGAHRLHTSPHSALARSPAQQHTPNQRTPPPPAPRPTSAHSLSLSVPAALDALHRAAPPSGGAAGGVPILPTTRRPEARHCLPRRKPPRGAPGRQAAGRQGRTAGRQTSRRRAAPRPSAAARQCLQCRGAPPQASPSLSSPWAAV